MDTARGITFFFLRRSAICPWRLTYAEVMLENISRIGCGGVGGHPSSLVMVERAVDMMARIVPGLADSSLSTLLRTSRASWRTAAFVSSCSLLDKRCSCAAVVGETCRVVAPPRCVDGLAYSLPPRHSPVLPAARPVLGATRWWSLQSRSGWSTPSPAPLGRARTETCRPS